LTAQRRALIVAGVRTAMGRFGGALSRVRVDDLAAGVIRAAVQRAGLADDQVDEVFAGTVNASGEAMGNVARFASLLAGLPPSVAGVTMNRYCGSGLSAVNALAHSISFGAAAAGVAVGAEVMSRSTWPVAIPAGEKYPGPLIGRNAMWSGAGGPQHPALEADGTMIEMPEGAQFVADKFSFGRSSLDAYALSSHCRAAQAWDSGRFGDEVVAVSTPRGSFEVDETFRRDSSLASLAALTGYYDGCPDITAGNASPVSDGASALVLVGPDVAGTLGGRPFGEIVATASVGVEPALFALGPVTAVRKLLAGTGVSLDDVGLFEINEAFAAQMLVCIDQLGLDPGRVNVNGGAIALGHALGNSGSRIMVTLVHEMRRRGTRYGIAALCVGAGQGIATLVRNLEALWTSAPLTPPARAG
jgi:acetyl-CoA C-acetyltransferase